MEIVTPPSEHEPQRSPESFQQENDTIIHVPNVIVPGHPLSVGSLSVAKHTTPLASLEEEEEQPMTISTRLNVEKQPQTQPPQYSRHLSMGVSMAARKPTVLEAYSVSGSYPHFRRSISAQPMHKPANLFSSNLQDVERILHRMADAIKKDLEL